MSDASEKPDKLLSKISRIVVVDDDMAVLHGLAKMAKDLGGKLIETFSEGVSAWEFLESNDCEFIMLDWKLKDAPGVALLNRIRAKEKLREVPVLIVSGYLTAKDFKLIEEFPLTSAIEKPFTIASLTWNISELLREKKWFADEKNKAQHILQNFNQDKDGNLEKIKTLVSGLKRPTAVVLAIGRALVDTDNLAHAEKFLVEQLERHPHSVAMISFYGKLLIKLKKYDDAKKFLLAAQKFSPENTERLCLLGSTELEMMNTSAASEYFSKALKIDKGSDQAKSGLTVAKNIDEYMSKFDDKKIHGSLASLLNAIGISMVRTGEYNKGIEHYESALKQVDDPMVKGRLAFNLGLGFKRWSKPEKAESWFQRSYQLSNGKFQKGLDYVTGEIQTVNLGLPPSEEQTDNESDFDLFEAETIVEKDSQVVKNIPSVEENNETIIDETSTAEFKPVESKSPAKPEIKVEAKADREVMFEELRKIIGNLRFPDPGLFAKVGASNLRKSYEAYSADKSGKTICILIPNNMMPTQVTKFTAKDAEDKKIIVFEKIKDGEWIRIWPITDDLKKSA